MERCGYEVRTKRWRISAALLLFLCLACVLGENLQRDCQCEELHDHVLTVARGPHSEAYIIIILEGTFTRRAAL